MISTGSGDPLTVSSSITITSGGSLGLLSGGTLTIDAPVSAQGTVAVDLAYNSASSTNLSFGLTGTGFDGSLTYLGSGGGALTAAPSSGAGSLTINGGSYTLEYSLASLAMDANANSSGSYALAENVLAPSTAYSGAVISSLSGTLEGLGHTITGLTITGTSTEAGLIGTLNGTVRDIGILGGTISGGSIVGGLVGYQNGGTITNAYATGAVSGSSEVGGLVGFQGHSTITNAYATGAVSGSSEVGGLVGFQGYSTITNAYATGAVSGSSSVGGLVGIQFAGTITNAYWDVQTTGRTTSSGGGTGLTTAQLQSGGSGLVSTGSAFSGGTGGLYPYLTSFYPNGVQAISGIAYTNAGTTAAASGANGAVTVNFDAGGSLLAQATTGNNGYYYVALPAGTVANGTSLLVSTPTNSATGAVNAATVAASTYSSGTPAQTGVNLYGGFLAEPVSATTLSGAPTLATFQQTANTLAGTDSTATAVIAGVSNPGYLTTGASFTVNQPYNGSGLLITTGSGDPLTISSSVTITSGGSLGLLSGGTLTIDAPVSAQGTVAVALAYDTALTTPSPTDLSFGLTGSGFTGSLTYLTSTGQTTANTAGAGGSLTINGQAYQIIYNLGAAGSTTATDFTAIDHTGDGGYYAQATPLTAPGSYTAALAGSGSNIFSGTFEGLGHTITSLIITGNSDYAGLIGTMNGGGIRDIGLVGGMISGGQEVGGLVGHPSGVTITNAYTTGAVSGSSIVGGLVGFQFSGTITNAYATGAVSGSSDVGGLVGAQGGSITNAYATGAVSGSSNLGGLAGTTGVSSITTNAYATGAVSGSSDVGGLVGLDGGTITNAYATGAVSGSSSPGGLVGVNHGTITNAYYDTLTTGQGGAGTGQNTSIFQTAAAAANLGAAFSGGTGLYPYLTSFYPNGVQAISGTAETSAGAAASGAQVAVYSGGSLLTGGTASAGANGYFYEIVPAGTLAPSNVKIGAALTLSGASTVSGLLYTDAGSVSNNVLALGTVKSALNAQTTAETTYSALQTDLGTTFGSTTLSALNTALAATATSIDATGASFTIDTSVSPGGNFAVATSGTDAPLTVAASSPVAGAGTVTLSATGNITLDAGVSASAGTVSISSSGGTLTTSSAAAVSATGNVTLTATGNVAIGSDVASSGGNTGIFATGSSANLTLNGGTISAGSGETVVLSAAGAFINTDSAGAVTTPTNGQWLIYSANPSGDTFDSLNSANTAIWGTSAATSLSSATVSASGDRYVFALSPTLTITTTNDTKTYGQTTTTNGLSSDYTITGLEAGVSGAYLGDAAASVYSGAPSISSNGLGASANVGGGGGTGGAYAITALATGLTIGDGYNATPAITNNGLLTINPAVLTYNATAAASTYGSTPTGLSGTVTGFVNGQTVANATTGTLAFTTAATAASNVGSYTIIGSGLTANNGNYTFVQATGNSTALTINPAILTYNATAASSAYGSTPTGLAGTVTGFVNGQTVANATTGTLAFTTAATAASNVGSYAITGSGLTADNGNYTFVQATGNSTALTINPAILTYNATAASSTYGSTPTGLAGTVTGFVNGQTVANATTGTLAFTTAATAASNVGSYAITGSGLTANNGNYTFVQATGNSTALTINPAILTYNATAAASTYGSTPTGLAGTVTGFVNGQTVANATTGTLAFTTTATAASNVGSYAITGSGLTANNGNYTFVQAAANATALTVNPALLSVSGLKTYDAATGFATGQLAVAGAQNGETIMLTQGSGTTASANAGTYAGSTLANLAIAVTGGNAMASNYTLPGTATLVIGQATITVAGASGVNKTYDATTSLPGGATGFTTSGVIGANATVSATSAQYASANAGMEPVTVAGLTITGAAAGDYVLSSTSVTGSGTISPASVTVTANGGSSIYGQTSVNPGLSATGLQGGQSVAVLTGLSNSFGITGQSNAGAYTLTVQGALTNANYTVAAANTGTFTVAQRALAIAANSEERAAAVANPPLTYQVGATTQTTGLVNGDGLTGALATSATAASPAGAYAISQGTLAASGNYVVSFTPGTLTIEPAAVVPTLSVDLSPTLLASTANRAFEQAEGDVSNALPFVFSSLSGDGSYASQLVAGLGNPRFDRIIVCVKNVCTLVPPIERKPQKTSQLESPAQ